MYLNMYIFDLKSSIKTKDSLYKIQINNRINEIEQLNDQLVDLQHILNIGLDLSRKDNIYLSTKLSDKDKTYILNSIPSSSPLEKTFITSKFGYRIHPVLNKKKLHTGLDLRAKIGTPIYSPADAVVSKARVNDSGGYGKMIVLSHNFGFKTLFAHMSTISVRHGQIIKKGDLLGLSGNSGQSNGPHLHYEVKFAEKYLNPIDFVYWNSKTFNTIFEKESNLDWENLILLIKKRTNNL